MKKIVAGILAGMLCVTAVVANAGKGETISLVMEKRPKFNISAFFRMQNTVNRKFFVYFCFIRQKSKTSHFLSLFKS